MNHYLTALHSSLFWTGYFLVLLNLFFWVLVYFSRRRLTVPSFLNADLPVVTIGIPAFNEEKTLPDTVRSVLSLDYPVSHLQVIIVNDGSTDRTGEIAESFSSQYSEADITVIHQENKGKGAALNAALDKARGSYFVCFDADSVIEPHALRKMLPWFGDRTVASVIPMMKAASPVTLAEKLQWYEYLLGILLKGIYGSDDCIHVIPWPFSMFRTDLLRKMGGWDPNRNLTEDFELTLRIQKANFRIIQTEEAAIHTHTPKTFRKLFRQRVRWYLGSLYNIVRHRDIILNRKLGDFGVFQGPALLLLLLFTNLTFFSGILLQAGSFFFSVPSESAMLPFLSQMPEDWKAAELIGFSITMIIFIILMKFSADRAGEKMFGQGVVPFFIYLTVYWTFLSAVWFYVIFRFLFIKKERKW